MGRRARRDEASSRPAIPGVAEPAHPLGDSALAHTGFFRGGRIAPALVEANCTRSGARIVLKPVVAVAATRKVVAPAEVMLPQSRKAAMCRTDEPARLIYFLTPSVFSPALVCALGGGGNLAN